MKSVNKLLSRNYFQFYTSLFIRNNMSSTRKFSGYRIQVVEPQMNAREVMKQIVRDGQEDSFFLCDVGEIVRKHRNWKKVMPRISTFYAVKCNDSTVVLETLAALGVGFDCASKEEIRRILSFGVQPERIIFAHPTKKISHIRYAAEVGVRVLTFDCEDELYKIKKEFPTANLVLRIRYDDSTAIYSFGKKFGVDTTTEAEDLLLIARSLHLNVIGISFHIGSGGKNHEIFSNAIAAAKNAFEIGTRLGFEFSLLDIGGGFPGEKDFDIGEIGDTINKAIDQHFANNSIQIIAEPGRYYADSAFTLAANIHTTKTVVKRDETGNVIETNMMYFVDAGTFGALLSANFGDVYTAEPLFEDLKGSLYSSIIWGPSCDAFDKLCDNIDLPRMRSGDWIVIDKAGAYSLCLACDFNGFPTPNVHSFINTEDWLLLTEKVPFPLSKTRYTKGTSPQHFRIGLDVHENFIHNKYHL